MSTFLKKENIFIILFMVFLLNPLIGILLSVAYAVSGKSYNLIIPLMIFCALYMAAINTTKQIDGDEMVYLFQFSEVPANGLYKTLTYMSETKDYVKEPAYGLLVFILYYLTLGNEMLFIAIVTIIIYIVFFAAVYNIFKENKSPNRIIVASVLTVVFFNQYFYLTAHLIRQLMATSVFFLALSHKSESIKKYLLLCLLSYTIHSSMILLILISLIPAMSRLFNKKTLILAGCVTFLFATLFPFIAEHILNHVGLSGDLGTAMVRAANAEGLKDASEGLEQSLVLLMTIPLISISSYVTIRNKPQIMPIVYNLCLIWCLFVICLSFSPLIQYRFFFVLYSFFPIIIYAIASYNRSFMRYFPFFICAFFIYRFYSTIGAAGFVYAPAINLILYPYPLIINL
jgi:hypothetical protein